MPSVPSTTNQNTQGTSSNFQKPDKFQELDMQAFLKLMITELQNQDPLNPADNTQLLTQLSQIREIASNDRLTNTLDALLLGDNMTTASGMIGKFIKGMTIDGTDVTGLVDRATFGDEGIWIHVGAAKIPLKNVREILPTPDTSGAPDLSGDLTQASQLIGCEVVGVLTDGSLAIGLVDRVSVSNNTVYLHSGGDLMALRDVQEVRWPLLNMPPDEATDPTAAEDAAVDNAA